MKFTQEDMANLKQIREENPEFSEMIDELKKAFPGSQLTYLKASGFEYGKQSEGYKVVNPAILDDRKGTPFEKKTYKTAGERRRAATRYKE